MTDTARLDYLDERVHPEIGPLLNALATIVNTLLATVDVQQQRIEQLEDAVFGDDWLAGPAVVDMPDIATYTEETP